MPGSASGISTLSTICSGVAPNERCGLDQAAIDLADRRLDQARDERRRGDRQRHDRRASMPIEVPAIRRVNGMIATTRMMKGVERVALTTMPSTRLTLGRREQLALAGWSRGRRRAAGRTAVPISGRDRRPCTGVSPRGLDDQVDEFRRHSRARSAEKLMLRQPGERARRRGFAARECRATSDADVLAADLVDARRQQRRRRCRARGRAARSACRRRLPPRTWTRITAWPPATGSCTIRLASDDRQAVAGHLGQEGLRDRMLRVGEDVERRGRCSTMRPASITTTSLGELARPPTSRG